MTHGARIVLAVFAAVGAAVVWFALTYGVVFLLGAVLDPSSLSDSARTALTTGVLGAALAGGVFAGMVSFFLVAGEPRSGERGRGGGAG